MNFLWSLFVFVVVVILYLHLTQQYKKGEHLEIYEMDYTTNKELQEICNLKQPVLFQMETHLFESLRRSKINGSFDVNVKNADEQYDATQNDAIKMSLNALDALIKTAPQHYTENNGEFVEDAGLTPFFSAMDKYLKPPHSIIVETKYDIMTGGVLATTPMRHYIHHRHFVAVIAGKIRVKMTPWKSTKFLHPNVLGESAVNVWNPQPEFHGEMEKLNFLDFEVMEGYVLYVPSYWWFSIQYAEEQTMLCGVVYNSAMNILAHIRYCHGVATEGCNVVTSPEHGVFGWQSQPLTKCSGEHWTKRMGFNTTPYPEPIVGEWQTQPIDTPCSGVNDQHDECNGIKNEPTKICDENIYIQSPTQQT